MKIVKAYSFDVQNIQKLEDRYPVGKRSEIVNESVKWYLGDDKLSFDKILAARDALQARVLELSKENEHLEKKISQKSTHQRTSWWRRLLLGQ